ncbi:hypothetical protein KTS45_18630 [Halomicroarcula limicola]|uniref:Uncharacterized protein n=1 Tax=Haloarcula limicola TaxID=1429915 RepID=A0A8J7Y8V6_9EURY|nr:hypothetical protein [Halomicroarcula limicola]MBV0926227.1 hypothetical protein [Halomicroarcula limicola]
MGDITSLSAGDEWPNHYRGFSLQISPNGSIWWQLYSGTDRLELSSPPTELVETLLELKHLGGRIHITEDGHVLTRVEEDESDDYIDIYVGDIELDGELVPQDNPEFGIPLRPDELSSGDLWPSVYDGSRYSFAGERVWWQNGSTNRRHMVDGKFPQDILETLRRYKSSGGSFRITPWGDVITLVPSHPAPGEVQAQFGDLPRVVQNIIKLRKERGVEMLPIYIGNVGDATIEVTEPRSLTDELSTEERDALSSWASGLGRTSTTSPAAHETESQQQPSEEDIPSTDEADDVPRFDDDPVDWMRDNIEKKEE